ncbi:MAG: SEC-C metal-binding domain-containing protein, partial [Usitatibacter sp.]
DGEPIEHPIVDRSIAKAQTRVESRNFDIRKQLLEYDDVANDQRKVIYQQRNELLEAQDMSELITALRRGVMTDVFKSFVPEESLEEQWDLNGLEKALADEWHLEVPLSQMLEAEPNLTDDDLLERLLNASDDVYAAKIAIVGREAFAGFERSVMLQAMDSHWREHLAALDHLRQGIHLRGYAQKNPKQEYKREAFELFGAMLDSIKREVSRHLLAVQVRSEEEVREAERRAEEAAHALKNVQYQHADFGQAVAEEAVAADPASGGPIEVGAGLTADVQPFVRSSSKVGRNDPCPCGSGKKFKQCHGRLA